MHACMHACMHSYRPPALNQAQQITADMRQITAASSRCGKSRPTDHGTADHDRLHGVHGQGLGRAPLRGGGPGAVPGQGRLAPRRRDQGARAAAFLDMRAYVHTRIYSGGQGKYIILS
jgi:hypothetical protein